MNIKKWITDGTLSRLPYFLSLLTLLFVGAIAAQVGREVSPGAFVIAWCVVYLLTSILDAKRLRDIGLPGKVALAIAAIYILAWAPYTYDVLAGTRLPYPFPLYLLPAQLAYLGGHLYLLFAKPKTERKTADLV